MIFRQRALLQKEAPSVFFLGDLDRKESKYRNSCWCFFLLNINKNRRLNH